MAGKFKRAIRSTSALEVITDILDSNTGPNRHPYLASGTAREKKIVVTRTLLLTVCKPSSSPSFRRGPRALAWPDLANQGAVILESAISRLATRYDTSGFAFETEPINAQERRLAAQADCPAPFPGHPKEALSAFDTLGMPPQIICLKRRRDEEPVDILGRYARLPCEVTSRFDRLRAQQYPKNPGPRSERFQDIISSEWGVGHAPPILLLH
jgi:hypothetical protein